MANPLERRMDPDLLESTPVTDLLYARLDPADVAAVEARVGAEDAALWREADPRDRCWLALAYGVHHGVPEVIAKTGLSPAVPPEPVHAMSRGALAAGGSYYYADLVADALAGVGARIAPETRALDFGCSSGRVVRVLAAAFPEAEWHACDPIASSIEWASEHLPGISFSVNPQSPPLALPDSSLDFAFAISIWSHFAEQPAIAWLEEMRRIVRPGGHLVLTTHGLHSISHYAENGLRTREQLEEIAGVLQASGFWFAPEFGERGDHGLVNPEWGTAFLSAEWLARKSCPLWRIAYFAAGRVEGNQDLVVLERPA